MLQSSREGFGASRELDATLSEPTAKLLVESMSRLKAAPAASARGPLAHLFPATLLDHSGPFRLVCEIASGGMASVHLAINRGVAGFEKFVAVKRIHSHLAQDKEFSEMFIDEARIAALVNHPYVCSVFDFGRADQSYYIAMEFLHGEPISKVLACAGDRSLSEPRFPHLVARIIANLAEGLWAAHSLCDGSGRSLDIIHRDMTPQNLFVLYDGTVRITDFGIARARHRLHHTHGERLKGTLSYMAPEQLQRSELDQGVDLWALGVVTWEMLTARKLFCSSSEGETVMDVMSQRIAPPSQFNPHVTPELDRIVLRALERNRSERYGSARELSRALEQYLTNAGDSVHAMDVAEWLTGLFPTGAQRGRELLDLARATAEALPRFELSDEATALVPVRAAASRDSMASLPALAIDEPLIESLPALASGVPPVFPARPRLTERVVALALTSSMVLVGLGVLGSLIRQLPPGASRAASQAVTYNALTPSALAAPAAKARPARPVLTPSVEPLRAPVPAHVVPKQAALRPKLAPSVPAAAPSHGALHGAIFVSSPGTSAEVFEGGRRLGRTPGQLELTPGRHSLLLKSGADARAVVVNVTAGEGALVSVSFAAALKDNPVSSDSTSRFQ